MSEPKRRPEGIPPNAPIFLDGETESTSGEACLVFLLSTTPAFPKASLPGRSRRRLEGAPSLLPRSYLVTDHIFHHFHATAGVATAQDKLIFCFLSLAAGVPEGQAYDGAEQSLGQGCGGCGGGTVRRHRAPQGLSISPQHQGLTTPQGSRITAMPLLSSPFLLGLIFLQRLRVTTFPELDTLLYLAIISVTS